MIKIYSVQISIGINVNSNAHKTLYWQTSLVNHHSRLS